MTQQQNPRRRLKIGGLGQEDEGEEAIRAKDRLPGICSGVGGLTWIDEEINSSSREKKIRGRLWKTTNAHLNYVNRSGYAVRFEKKNKKNLKSTSWQEKGVKKQLREKSDTRRAS